MHLLNPEKALEAPGFAGLEGRRVHSWEWTHLSFQLGGSRPSSVETQAAAFAWEHRQEAMGFVAVGLCLSAEGEELEKVSLVLEACLTPLCAMPCTASFHKYTQQQGSEVRGEGRQ